MRLRGAAALKFGLYEAYRLAGFLWPVVSASIVAYITAKITELQSGGSLVTAGVLAGLLKLAQLYFGDNSRDRVEA